MRFPRPHPRLSTLLATTALAVATLLSGCGGGDDGPAAAPYAEMKSVQPLTLASVPNANVKLLTHTMPAWSGGTATATTLLLTPKGTAPAGGWPVLAWAHGTTTVAKASCAPSLTPDTLDGGLTAEGFTSEYAKLLGSYVAAGYAVVAPDFEGLGPAATTPFPYYHSASESRSLIAAVKAARLASAELSTAWVAVGHSEGGRGVLALSDFVGEAPELDFRGIVAYAPFVSLAAAVEAQGALAAAKPADAPLHTAIQNFFVGMLSTALETVTPGVDLTPMMGADLAALRPVLRAQCIFSSFGKFAQTVGAKPAGTFAGFTSGWADTPAMKAFLATNDVGAMSNFRLRVPTLVVQGTEDVFVLEPLTTQFVQRLTAGGSSVTYRVYPGADHGTIVDVAGSEVRNFLAARFAR